jgi:hypothetical protein
MPCHGYLSHDYPKIDHGYFFIGVGRNRNIFRIHAGYSTG